MINYLKKIISVITIATVVIFLFPYQTYAGVVIVQTKGCNGGGYVNTYTCAFTTNITAGDMLVADITAGSANTITTFNDNNSNTWTQVQNDSTAGNRQSWLYYVKSANAGATTITVTFGASQFADSALILREYSGLTSNPLDQSAKGSDYGSFVQSHTSSTTPATTQANELIVVGGGVSSSTEALYYTAGSGYGNVVGQQGFDSFTSSIMEDKTVSVTGTQTGTYTTQGFDNGQTLIATFIIASAQPAIVTVKNKTVIKDKIIIK